MDGSLWFRARFNLITWSKMSKMCKAGRLNFGGFHELDLLQNLSELEDWTRLDQYLLPSSFSILWFVNDNVLYFLPHSSKILFWLYWKQFSCCDYDFQVNLNTIKQWIWFTLILSSLSCCIVVSMTQDAKIHALRRERCYVGTPLKCDVMLGCLDQLGAWKRHPT